MQLPNLLIVGNQFLMNNISINELSLPNLEICGSYFMWQNKKIKTCTLNANIHNGKFFMESYFNNLPYELQKQLVKTFKN